MSSKISDAIYGNMNSKNTKELLSIWKENDKSNYTDETFEIISQILQERNVNLPDQNDPDGLKKETEEFHSTNWIQPDSEDMDRETDSMVFFGFFAVFSLFLLIGLIIIYFTFLIPVYKIIRAGNWHETNCIILESHPRGSSRIDIRYAYEVDGREYESAKYDFAAKVEGQGSVSINQSIVDKLAAGTRTVCYVNPDNPAEAVLNRGVSPTLWIGWIPKGSHKNNFTF